MGNLETNSKFCKTCNELSPAELNKCQYCGSELSEVLDEVDQDLNLKIIIGKMYAEQETEKPILIETQSYDNVTNYTEVTVEKQDNNNNNNNNDQVQFNDIFGFKSSNVVQEKMVKDDSISNKQKVLLSVICSIVPGFGQLFCLILSIVFMNSEDNEDKKTFGSALFVASIVLFVLTCIISFLFALLVYQPPM